MGKAEPDLSNPPLPPWTTRFHFATLGQVRALLHGLIGDISDPRESGSQLLYTLLLNLAHGCRELLVAARSDGFQDMRASSFSELLLTASQMRIDAKLLFERELKDGHSAVEPEVLRQLSIPSVHSAVEAVLVWAELVVEGAAREFIARGLKDPASRRQSKAVRTAYWASQVLPTAEFMELLAKQLQHELLLPFRARPALPNLIGLAVTIRSRKEAGTGSPLFNSDDHIPPVGRTERTLWVDKWVEATVKAHPHSTLSKIVQQLQKLGVPISRSVAGRSRSWREHQRSLRLRPR